MKNLHIIFCLLLLLNFSNLKAQHPYIPIPDNAEWVYGMIDGNCAPPLNLCGYSHYKISGDTIIGDYTYKKFMGTGLKDTNYTYLAAIRQDITARKVYVVKAEYSGGCSNMDTLLYDFSAGQGDTLKQCDDIIGGALNPTIESVDSVLVAGLWRKKINLNLMNNPSLIEGIGSSSGFLGQWGGWIGGYNFLACYSINGVPVFPDSLCTFVGINSNTLSYSEIQISPNPASSKSSIYINMPYPITCKVKIYNLTKSICKNIFTGGLVSGTNIIEFDVSDFTSGFYVLQTIYDNFNVNKLIVIVH